MAQDVEPAALRSSTDIADQLKNVGVASARFAEEAWVHDHSIPARIVGSFRAETEEPIRVCRDRAQRLARGGVDVSELEERITFFEDALVAPSIKREEPTPRAACLLLSRTALFLRDGFSFLKRVAEIHDFREFAAQCGFLVRMLSPAARRGEPFASPATYSKHLSRFRDLDGGQRGWREEITAAMMQELPRASFNAAPPPPSRLRGAEPYLPRFSLETAKKLEVSTPILNPEVLADSYNMPDRTYRVWYGTDRAPIEANDVALGFSGTSDQKVHYGSCLVFVPESHQVGSLGSNWILRTFLRRPDDRVVLNLILPLTRDAFVRRAADELARRREQKTALIYVHGFNTTFKLAAERAAQLGCDLGVSGIMAFYSWASVGQVSAYPRDEETVRTSVDRFIEFLETVRSIPGVDRVDIVAHSMGNRIVASALDRLALASRTIRLGHIVLAAPDIARAEFGRIGHLYGAAVTERTTLYSCAKDRALALSTKFHKYLRLGYEPPVYCHPGIDTVSASNLRLDRLAHGYIASARPVIEDLRRLLWMNAAPDARRLIPIPDMSTPEYWIFPREGR